MGTHLDLAKTIGPADRQIIKGAFTELKRRVTLALADANAGAARFNTWFCPAGAANLAAVQLAVTTTLTAMNTFLNGATSYTLTVTINTGVRTGSTAYGFVYPDLGRLPQRAGQLYIIYLGAHWQGQLAVGQAATGAAHGRDTQVQVLAHELSHHFGTNSAAIAGGAYSAEHYDAAALALVAANPLYAAHNADNYEYYVEEM